MKSVPYVTSALLLLALSGFSFQKPSSNCQPCKVECCEIREEPCYQPAYNAPASIHVTPKCWKFWSDDLNTIIDLSFTYWWAGEEGLNIASTGVLNSGVAYFAPETKSLTQEFDYKPGFKVGLGVVAAEEWTVMAEYTWFRGEDVKGSGPLLSGTSPTAGTASALSGTPIWLADDWFLQGSSSGQALAGSSVSSKWHLALDLIDATAGRPYYQGKYVTIFPFAGLRSAFIRQKLEVHLTEAPDQIASLPSQPISSHNHSNSWSIGPVAGMEFNWLLPIGFRFEGDFAASLLYTRYTSIKHSEDVASTTFNSGPYRASMSGFSAVRPGAEIGLGLGWGRYLDCNRYHIDFSADYDFMIFWSQNVMRKLLDDALTGTSTGTGDLYFHGLTLTGRFDF